MVWGAVIAGAAKVAGGLLSKSGQKSANKTNLLIAREKMAFEDKQALRQMDFQEDMSNTAYQRATTDLEAAGLNRILALGNPASSPPGAMGAGALATMQNVNAGLGEAIGDAPASALAAQQAVNSNKLTKEQIRNTAELTKQSTAQAAQIRQLLQESIAKETNTIAQTRMTSAQTTRAELESRILQKAHNLFDKGEKIAPDLLETIKSFGQGTYNDIRTILESYPNFGPPRERIPKLRHGASTPKSRRNSK